MNSKTSLQNSSLILEKVPKEPYETDEFIRTHTCGDPPPPPPHIDLELYYKIMCDTYGKTNLITDIPRNCLKVVPWIIFSFTDPLSFWNDINFINLYINLVKNQSKILLSNVVASLWQVLLIVDQTEYSLNNSNAKLFFSIWTKSLLELLNIPDIYTLQSLKDINNRFQIFTDNGSDIGIANCIEDSINIKNISQSLTIRYIKGITSTGYFAKQVYLGYLNKITDMMQSTENFDFVNSSLIMLDNDEHLFNTNFIKPSFVINSLLYQFNSEIRSSLEVKYRNIIKKFILNHYNDPRFNKNTFTWIDVDEYLKKIFITWLLIDELEFYFDIISQSSVDQWVKRKEFWLNYIKNDYIHDIQPLFGSEARAYANQSNQKLNFSILNRASPNQSVLLIKFDDITIVEWSNNGACRIWKTNNPNAPKFHKFSYNATDDLRTDCDERITHNSKNWQSLLGNIIEKFTGISPLS
jgi:hypothetical protein